MNAVLTFPNSLQDKKPSAQLRVLPSLQQALQPFNNATEAANHFLKALQFADKPFAQEIEVILVHLGPTIAPVLLGGLASKHRLAASTCAMALLRFGSSVKPLLQEKAAVSPAIADLLPLF